MGLLDANGNGKPPARVVIGWPSQDSCKTDFAYDAFRLALFTANAMHNGVPIANLQIRDVRGTLIAPQRRDIVKLALDGDFTHILWMDTDMRFPKSGLIQLLGRNKAIVAANYPTRKMPSIKVTAVESFDHDVDPEPIHAYTEPESTGLQSVRSVGMGFMLTRTEVFRRIPEPWFTVNWLDQRKGYEGEDVAFCRKAREAGYEIFVDHDTSKDVSHVGQMVFTHDHAMIHREEALKAAG